jgi:hypothetical protein
MSVAMIGICVPSLLMGPILILVFGIYLEWLPVSGWGDIPGDKILPAITLGSTYAAYIARLSRAGNAGSDVAGLHPHRARQGTARMAGRGASTRCAAA